MVVEVAWVVGLWLLELLLFWFWFWLWSFRSSVEREGRTVELVLGGGNGPAALWSIFNGLARLSFVEEAVPGCHYYQLKL